MRYRPVTPQTHGAARWQKPVDWSFARALPLVPVVAPEASALATALPLVFVQVNDCGDDEAVAKGNAFQLVALLRLEGEGTSPFIGENGQWQAAQIPPMLWFAPFAFAPVESFSAAASESDRPFALLVDEDSPLLCAEDGSGQQMFARDGSPTPELASIIAEFERRCQAVQLTARAIAQLQHEGLLVPWRPAGVGNDPRGAEEPLFEIDAAKLQSLSAAAVARLHAAHAMGLAYVQIVSMYHVPWMQKATRLAQRVQNQGKGLGPKNGPESQGPIGRPHSDAQAFLSALAVAQDEDLVDATGAFLADFPVANEASVFGTHTDTSTIKN